MFDKELREVIEEQNSMLLGRFPKERKVIMADTSDIGDMRMREIVTSAPLTEKRAHEILEKYNSIARDMNVALKKKMAGHGYNIMFGDRGAQMVGRKGITVFVDDYVKVTKKLRNYGRSYP